jgi:hypothetical protein
VRTAQRGAGKRPRHPNQLREKNRRQVRSDLEDAKG